MTLSQYKRPFCRDVQILKIVPPLHCTCTKHFFWLTGWRLVWSFSALSSAWWIQPMTKVESKTANPAALHHSRCSSFFVEIFKRILGTFISSLSLQRSKRGPCQKNDSFPGGTWQLFRSFQGNQYFNQIQNWFSSEKNTERALLECKYLEVLYSLLLFF